MSSSPSTHRARVFVLGASSALGALIAEKLSNCTVVTVTDNTVTEESPVEKVLTVSDCGADLPRDYYDDLFDNWTCVPYAGDYISTSDSEGWVHVLHAHEFSPSSRNSDGMMRPTQCREMLGEAQWKSSRRLMGIFA